MRSVLLFALGTLLGLVVGLTCVAVFVGLGYQDETVAEQGAFGLAIGQSKKQVFDNVGLAFREISPTDTRIFMEVQVDEATAQVLGMEIGRHAMVQTSLEPSVFSRLEAQDSWKFYVQGSYFNSLTLRFCDEKLCEIHRHKKLLELP